MHTKVVMTKHSILKTIEFEHWLGELPEKTKAIILARLDMVSIGHLGDHKRFEDYWNSGGKMELESTDFSRG